MPPLYVVNNELKTNAIYFLINTAYLKVYVHSY